MSGTIPSALPVFEAASPQAAAISKLFVLTLIVCAAILILVAGLVLYAAVRYRFRSGAGEPLQHAGDTRLEVAWTAGALIVVAGLFALTVATMRAADPPAAGREPDLVVTGHQWWWEVRYPGSGVVTANEIHVPVGRRLLVRLESADVIHDFWVPQLGRKMDMVPGHPNHVWLEASRPGTYLGACSEFCGAQHAWMRFRVVAEPPEAFDTWQRAQRADAAAPTNGEAARGARLFRRMTCVNCHAVAGTEAKARIGPDLTHLASRRMLAAEVLENTPRNLARWLKDPQDVKPGSHMPDLGLGDAEVRSLAAYMETLR